MEISTHTATHSNTVHTIHTLYNILYLMPLTQYEYAVYALVLRKRLPAQVAVRVSITSTSRVFCSISLTFSTSCWRSGGSALSLEQVWVGCSNNITCAWVQKWTLPVPMCNLLAVVTSWSWGNPCIYSVYDAWHSMMSGWKSLILWRHMSIYAY